VYSRVWSVDVSVGSQPWSPVRKKTPAPPAVAASINSGRRRSSASMHAA